VDLWPQIFSHVLIFDDAEGYPLVRDAAEVPLYASEAEVVGIEESGFQRFTSITHHIEYEPGTRHVRRRSR
jgi:hypothetical protein